MKFDDNNVYDYDAYDTSDKSESEENYDMQVNIAAGDANDRCMRYTILSLNKISERQRNAIATVCNVLSVSEVEAGIILRHFYWDINNVYDQWFANEEKVTNAVGLLSQPNVKEEKREESIRFCGHRFCGHGRHEETQVLRPSLLRRVLKTLYSYLNK